MRPQVFPDPQLPEEWCIGLQPRSLDKEFQKAELPADASSDDEHDLDDYLPHPDSDAAQLPDEFMAHVAKSDGHCDCLRGCNRTFTDADWIKIEENRFNLNSLGLNERNKEAFALIKDQLWDPVRGAVKFRPHYTYNSRDVCMHYWSFLTGISRTKIGEVKRQLKVGLVAAPPVHETRSLQERDHKAFHLADQFFATWYWDIGQSLAETINKDQETSENQDCPQEMVLLKDHPLVIGAIGTDAEASGSKEFMKEHEHKTLTLIFIPCFIFSVFIEFGLSPNLRDPSALHGGSCRSGLWRSMDGLRVGAEVATWTCWRETELRARGALGGSVA